jgi:hypothetical protein
VAELRTAALLLLYCCFTAAVLLRTRNVAELRDGSLLYCCFTAALLLLYCCFTAALLQVTLNAAELRAVIEAAGFEFVHEVP